MEARQWQSRRKGKGGDNSVKRRWRKRAAENILSGAADAGKAENNFKVRKSRRTLGLRIEKIHGRRLANRLDENSGIGGGPRRRLEQFKGGRSNARRGGEQFRGGGGRKGERRTIAGAAADARAETRAARKGKEVRAKSPRVWSESDWKRACGWFPLFPFSHRILVCESCATLSPIFSGTSEQHEGNNTDRSRWPPDHSLMLTARR